MSIPRIVGSTFFAIILLTASLAYALPSCCDQGSAGAPAATLQSAPRFSTQPAPAVQAARRPVPPAVAGRPAAFPAVVAQAGQTPQRNAGPGLPDCCAAPPLNAPAAPSCCQVPQRVASAGCCSAPGAARGYQQQAAPAPGQYAGPGCGGCGGCGGAGARGAVAPMTWSQTAQPIGNFTGNQVRSQVRPVPANAAVPRQGRASASAQGFGQPGYFGNVSPVQWTLY